MQFKNYIFDLYGTLIDIKTDETKPVIWSTLAELYREYGAFYSPNELRDTYYHFVEEELNEVRKRLNITYADIKIENVFLKLLEVAIGKDAFENLFNNKEKYESWGFNVSKTFRDLSMVRFTVYPKVHETLRILKDSGAKIYLLSNAQSVFTLPEIEKAGLKEYFDAIYISSDFCTAKPEPSFMQALLNEQQLDPKECVMVGNDCSSDMAVAISCGVKGIFLNTNGHSEEEINGMIQQNQFSVIRSGHIEEILE